jgi:hypothetical protein
MSFLDKGIVARPIATEREMCHIVLVIKCTTHYVRTNKC